MTFKMEIPQLNNFKKGLKSLPEKVAKRILQRALKKAAEEVMIEAKNHTHDRTGKLDASMKVRTKKISEVAAQALLEAGAGGAFYASMVEYGSRYTIVRNNHIVAAGTIPANPFFRPAFDQKKQAAIEIIASEVGAGVAKEFKKLGGGAK